MGNIKNIKGVFAQKVNIEDALNEELENKYMKVFEDLITQKTYQVQFNESQAKGESEALIAIRKEYIRKNMDIQELDSVGREMYQEIIGLEDSNREL